MHETDRLSHETFRECVRANIHIYIYMCVCVCVRERERERERESTCVRARPTLRRFHNTRRQPSIHTHTHTYAHTSTSGNFENQSSVRPSPRTTPRHTTYITPHSRAQLSKAKHSTVTARHSTTPALYSHWHCCNTAKFHCLSSSTPDTGDRDRQSSAG